jgi:hypothetical protein
MISEYYVGQKPARPLAIDVRGSEGQTLDLSFYDEYRISLFGPDESEIDDLGNAELQTAGSRVGHFVLTFPTTKSLFDKPGDYALQLELAGDGREDFTTTHTIRVRERGKNR